MKRLLVFLPLVAWTGLLFAHGVSEEDKLAMISGGYSNFMWLGTTHMLTGYDHLLFIFGVVFFLDNFSDIVEFITAFTVGHSITLIFATLGGITANYFLVDAIIALSVCYKGFDNLGGFKKYFGINSPNLIKMVFLFGLIHGFGLSTRLQQLPLGEETTGLVLRILSFNVGVELGQIAALVVILFFIAEWRKRESFKPFSIIANTTIVAAGVFLFFMQMHGYSHEAYSDDYPLNKDDHSHIHMEMDEAKIEELGQGLMQ